jgi:uncharacterized protein (TIGR02284 family)
MLKNVYAMEDNNKYEGIASGINKLIQINNDRIEGYERATDETNDAELKAMFMQFASQSRQFRSQLEILVREYGEEPVEGTTASGKLYRVWMDIKSALTGKDKKAIINNCEYGEDVAKDEYKNFLEDDDNEDVPERVKMVVQSQYAEIKQAHDTVKRMREVYADDDNK